jgi:hypothetical protein
MSPTTSIDLTGLPDAVVREVRRLVHAARGAGDGPPHSPNQTDAGRWSAELRAWAASRPAREITLDDDREGIYAGCGE